MFKIFAIYLQNINNLARASWNNPWMLNIFRNHTAGRGLNLSKPGSAGDKLRLHLYRCIPFIYLLSKSEVASRVYAG